MMTLRYIETLPAETILVVAHRAFDRAFRRAALNIRYADEYVAEFKIGNAEILELVIGSPS